ncbi:hypothetical protein [Capnocytophaga canimorsus]|uniref:hypothetical protein n=2 Tax=Capnocytophaga canimorsus TaxID=28188 RepID=UPI0037D8271F
METKTNTRKNWERLLLAPRGWYWIQLYKFKTNPKFAGLNWFLGWFFMPFILVRKDLFSEETWIYKLSLFSMAFLIWFIIRVTVYDRLEKRSRAYYEAYLEEHKIQTNLP